MLRFQADPTPFPCVKGSPLPTKRPDFITKALVQTCEYHDDGEDDLLGTIATMSIGGDAVMKLRMKSKWYSAKNLKINTYDPTEEVIPGMQGWQDRLELNSLYGQVSEKEFNVAKKKFFMSLQRSIQRSSNAR